MLNIGSIVIAIIISLIVTAITYIAIENFGFLGGFFVCYIGGILSSILSGNKINAMNFVAGIIPSLIEMLIFMTIYNKSNSFSDFMKKCICISVTIIVIFAVIMFGMSKISGKKSESNVEESVENYGEYTLGDNIKVDEMYTYKITKIVPQNSMTLTSNKKVYYPEEG